MEHKISLLIESLKAGDEEAFEKLFRFYKDDVYTYALSLIKSPDVSKEIVQETFIKVWINREGLKNDLSLKSYIYTIARNLVIDTLRRAKRDLVLRQEIYNHSQKLYNPILTAVNEENFKLICDKAIQQLSPKRKEVFLLSREDNLSYEEISEQLGISVNTVKNHISKALELIREYLHRNKDILFFIILIYISF